MGAAPFDLRNAEEPLKATIESKPEHRTNLDKTNECFLESLGSICASNSVFSFERCPISRFESISTQKVVGILLWNKQA